MSRKVKGSVFASGHQAVARGLAGENDVKVRSIGARFYNANDFPLLYWLREFVSYVQREKPPALNRRIIETIWERARQNIHKTNEIVIAHTPDWCDKEYRNKLDGGLLHEIFHSLYTLRGTEVDFDKILEVVGPHYDPDIPYVQMVDTLFMFNNLFEDAFIERLGTEEFKGALYKIQHVHELVWDIEKYARRYPLLESPMIDDEGQPLLGDDGKPLVDYLGNPLKSMSSLSHLICYLRDRVEHYLRGAPLEEYHPEARAVVDQFFAEVIEDSDKTESSYDVMGLAFRSIAILHSLNDVLEHPPEDGESPEEPETPEEGGDDVGQDQDQDQDQDDSEDDVNPGDGSGDTGEGDEGSGDTGELDKEDAGQDPVGSEGSSTEEDKEDGGEGNGGDVSPDGDDDGESEESDTSGEGNGSVEDEEDYGGDEGVDSDDAGGDGGGDDDGGNVGEGNSGKNGQDKDTGSGSGSGGERGSAEDSWDGGEEGSGKPLAGGNQDTSSSESISQEFIADLVDPEAVIEAMKDIADALQHAWDDLITPGAPQHVLPYSTDFDSIHAVQAEGSEKELELYNKVADRVRDNTLYIRPRMLSFFRGQKKTRVIHRQERGRRLSSRSIAEVVYKEKPRPFMNKTSKTARNSVVSLVLDESASMDVLMDGARDIMTTLALTIGSLKIPFEVLGFSTNGRDAFAQHMRDNPDLNTKKYRREVSDRFTRVEGVGYRVYREFDEPFNVSSYRKLVHMEAREFTPLPDAIQMVASRLRVRPEEQKIAFVVTDGVPQYQNRLWSSRDYQNIITNQLDEARREGIEIMLIGLGYSAEYTERYPNSLWLDNPDSFAPAFATFIFEQMKRITAGQ